MDNAAKAATIRRLQELIAIITAIGITFGLETLFRGNDITPSGIVTALAKPHFEYSTPQSFLDFLLVLLTAFRFNYLNGRYLDYYYIEGKVDPILPHLFLVEFPSIILEGVIIASMSFFVDMPSGLFFLLAVALLVDVVWAALGLIIGPPRNRDLQIWWIPVNGSFGVALLLLVLLGFGLPQWAYYWIGVVLLLSSTGLSFGFANRTLFRGPPLNPANPAAA